MTAAAIASTAKFGKSQVRIEDHRFLTGQGRYIDDIVLPGQLHAAFVRSPHAHAHITAFDTKAAAAMPGVRLVITGAEWARENYLPLPCRSPVKADRDGKPFVVPPRQCLIADTVRYVGEPVAVVIADTAADARRAAEAVAVDYDPLPSVTLRAEALAVGAPQLWAERPGNVCMTFEAGKRAATDAAIAAAAHVVKLDMENNRVAAVAMEPRGTIAGYDAETKRFTLWNSSQNIHSNRGAFAQMLRLTNDQIHHLAPDVGGGFGVKNCIYPEPVVLLHAARALGRPVKWVADRTESFLADAHGRDQQSTVTLALDADHRFAALKVETIGNVGGVCGTLGPFTPTGGTARTTGGPYAIPVALYSADVAYTNTVQTDPYRGAGRPEAVFHIERIVELAARSLGVDPVELRRKNLITPQQLPYTTAVGLSIDVADFPVLLDRVLAMSDRPGYAARVAASKANGLRRGFAVTPYLETSGGDANEEARLTFNQNGTVTLAVGTHSTGMGHETAFAQIVSERLGLPLDRIRFIQADTDATSHGGGHGGSRSIEVGGSAVLKATEQVAAAARTIAAHMLNSTADDITFAPNPEGATLTDKKTGQSVTLAAVIAASHDESRLPANSKPGALDTIAKHARENYTVPNGAHACEVEVDPETGVVRLDKFWIVDDFGSVINPMLADGQVMGGVAQGIGQALLEEVVYDRHTGQPLSASLLDYALPRADHMPRMEIAFFEGAPTKRNPLGAKGTGEAGCCGATPVVVNAVLDALAPYGITHIDMPLLPEKVWRAIHIAKA